MTHHLFACNGSIHECFSVLAKLVVISVHMCLILNCCGGVTQGKRRAGAVSNRWLVVGRQSVALDVWSIACLLEYVRTTSSAPFVASTLTYTLTTHSGMGRVAVGLEAMTRNLNRPAVDAPAPPPAPPLPLPPPLPTSSSLIVNMYAVFHFFTVVDTSLRAPTLSSFDRGMMVEMVVECKVSPVIQTIQTFKYAKFQSHKVDTSQATPTTCEQ